MMQNPTFNIQTVPECVEEITKELKYHRSDENFESVINSPKKIADILDVDPVFPKIRSKKKENNVWL
jgi:hypothetical protein